MIELFAPAKLTLSLTMVGLRHDGFHLLESEMVTVSLADRLTLDEGGTGTVVRPRSATSSSKVSVVGENLCDRALALVGKSAGVEIDKAIPVGGGLGGGSADAAAILRWANCDDLELAAALGSDVPFCVVGGRAFVRGIGELVEPAPFIERTFTLVLPHLGVSTVSVYRAFDEVGRGKSEGRHQNDLTAAARAVSSELDAVMGELQRRTGTAPSLAGSGSTLFYEGNKEDFGLSEQIMLAGVECTVIDVVTVPPKWNEEE